MKVSFIIPVFNEEGNIRPLYAELLSLKRQLNKEVEIFFINDGSTDTSLELLIDIAQQDPSVQVISLSRNFGHQAAITAGLDHVNGDAAIVMDSDLQDPPMVSLDLINKWEQGYEVVYARRRSRKDPLLKRLMAYLFYRSLAAFADIHIPKDTGDFRLMDKKVVGQLKRLREKNRYLRGLTSYVGFRQSEILFDRRERHSGTTKYPFKKMLLLALDAITGYSTKPLRLIIFFGLIAAMISFVCIIYTLYIKLFTPEIVVPGWTFTIITIFFLGGIQMIMLGIMGEYIGRIYQESQDRPLYIIDTIYTQHN
jgi:dolichol-phosphate mannosyltransferase